MVFILREFHNYYRHAFIPNNQDIAPHREHDWLLSNICDCLDAALVTNCKNNWVENFSM